MPRSGDLHLERQRLVCIEPIVRYATWRRPGLQSSVPRENTSIPQSRACVFALLLVLIE
jgi:hypothetical protein